MNSNETARQIVENWNDLSDLETRIRLALESAVNSGAKRQRESDARLVEGYHEYPSTNDYSIAAAIRANTNSDG